MLPCALHKPLEHLCLLLSTCTTFSPKPPLKRPVGMLFGCVVDVLLGQRCLLCHLLLQQLINVPSDKCVKRES
jgi:hypothetical protein